MKVRCQISAAISLDKCVNCHSCSIACKALWTAGRGTEYMWWNNVETKPGVGFPKFWEDQGRYKGGWKLENRGVKLRSGGRLRALAEIFHNPAMPAMEDFYEPWDYRHEQLIESPLRIDQPTTSIYSSVSGQCLDQGGSPNSDDELAGSEQYARNDPNLDKYTSEGKVRLSFPDQLFFSLPRICNHCLNPACVAACPSGAVYKRGEDGITLVDQKSCRGWRQCVTACPYKKVYLNWARLKAEKCIYCYPLLERGQVPACFQSCTGRARYLGYLLYDADRIEEIAKAPEQELVELQRSVILDPADPAVTSEAMREGISPTILAAARRSPVYHLVVSLKLAFPLHPEFRTLPMAFYIPPLLPASHGSEDENRVLPPEGQLITFLARLFAGGNEAEIRQSQRRIEAIRKFRRAISTTPQDLEKSKKALEDAGLSPVDAEKFTKLANEASPEERFALAESDRANSLHAMATPDSRRKSVGLGTAEEDSKP